MTIKQVWFVRHAESRANVGGESRISGDSVLTERGRRQAVLVSERLKKVPVDAIISSTLVRAAETAAHIADKKETHFERHDLFVERKFPNELLGKHRRDEDTRQKYALWEQSFLYSGRRVGDGENYDLLFQRAKDIFSYIEERPEEKLIVVTHGYLMRMVVAHAYFGETLTAEMFRSFETVVKTTNTGIFEFMWNRKGIKRWEVITWNDYAHLGYKDSRIL